MAQILLRIVLALAGLYVMALLYELISVNNFKKFWNKLAAKTAQDGDLRYVVLGDSAAQGVGCIHPKYSYPYLISQWLARQTGRHTYIVNLSVSGAKIEDVIKLQVPLITKYGPPHVVTLAIGANDISNFNAEKFEAQLKQLVMILPRETYIATVPAFTARARSNDWKAEQASLLMQRVVAATNHHIVHLYQATKRNASIYNVSADLFHPNARGYRHWANTFEQTMAQQIPELIQTKQ